MATAFCASARGLSTCLDFKAQRNSDELAGMLKTQGSIAVPGSMRKLVRSMGRFLRDFAQNQPPAELRAKIECSIDLNRADMQAMQFVNGGCFDHCILTWFHLKYLVFRSTVRVKLAFDDALLTEVQTQCDYAEQEKTADGAVTSLSVITRMFNPIKMRYPDASPEDVRYLRAAAAMCAYGYLNGTLRHTRGKSEGEVLDTPPPDDVTQAEPSRDTDFNLAKPTELKAGITYKWKRDEVQRFQENDMFGLGGDETAPRTTDLNGVTAPLRQSPANEISALCRHARDIPDTRTDDGKERLRVVGGLIKDHFLAHTDLYHSEYPAYPKSWSDKTKEYQANQRRDVLQSGRQEGHNKPLEIGIPVDKHARGIAHTGPRIAAAAAEAICPAETIWKKLFVGVHIKGLDDDSRIEDIGEWLKMGAKQRVSMFSNDYSKFDSTITLEDKLWECDLSTSVMRAVLAPMIGDAEVDALNFGGAFEKQVGQHYIVWDMNFLTVRIPTGEVWRFSGERGTSFHNFLQSLRVFLAEVLRLRGVKGVVDFLNGRNWENIAFRGEGDDSLWRVPAAWYHTADELTKAVAAYGKIIEPVKSKWCACEFCSWHFFCIGDEQQIVGFPKLKRFFAASQKQCSKGFNFTDDHHLVMDDCYHKLCASSLLSLADALHQGLGVRQWCLAWARHHIARLEDQRVTVDEGWQRLIALGLVPEPEVTYDKFYNRVAEKIANFPVTDAVVEAVARALVWTEPNVDQKTWSALLEQVRMFEDGLCGWEPTEEDLSSPGLVHAKFFDCVPIIKTHLGVVRIGQSSDVPRRTDRRGETSVPPGLTHPDGTPAEFSGKTEKRRGESGRASRRKGSAATSGAAGQKYPAPRKRANTAWMATGVSAPTGGE